MKYTFTGMMESQTAMFVIPLFTFKTKFMKKNRYFLLLLIVTSTAYICGCKKSDSTSNPVAISNLDTSLLNNLQFWLADQKDHVGKNGKPMVDSLMSNAKWDQGEQRIISAVQSMVYIPVSNQTLGLAFFYNTQKRTVDSCFLVDVNSDKSNYSFKKMDVIQARYLQPDSKTNHGFTGQITDFTLDNKFKSEIKYNNGIVASQKTLRSKGAAKVGNITTLLTCIAWYWVTTYGDGTEYWQYMYTQCNDCDEQPFSIGITTAKTYIRKGNCVGGGGTGPVTSDNVCNYTSDEAKEIVKTVFIEASSGTIINTSNGPETMDKETFRIKEPRLIFIDALRINYYVSNVTQYYEAIFGGVRFRNDPTDLTWKWEELKFQGLSSRAASTPPCFEVVLNSAASPIVFSDDLTSADVIVFAEADIRLNCTPSGSWHQNKISKTSTFKILARNN